MELTEYEKQFRDLDKLFIKIFLKYSEYHLDGFAMQIQDELSRRRKEADKLKRIAGKYIRPKINNSRTRLLEVLKKSNYECVACKAKENLTIDHIKPLRWGGSDELENLQILCKSCNTSKSDKLTNSTLINVNQ